MEYAPILAGALAGLLAGVSGARWALRHAFATEREQVRAVLARGRIDLEEAASQLEKWSERGARERSRVEQAERRARPREPVHEEVSPAFPDVLSYKRHLARGGARDREYEKAQGW